MRAGGTWGDQVRGQDGAPLPCWSEDRRWRRWISQSWQAELANGVACCWFLPPDLLADLPH